jgi:hypothetical protein
MAAAGLWQRNVLSWAMVLLVSLSMAACHRQPKVAEAPPPKPDQLWSRFIASHTAGTVSRHSHIAVHFTRDVIPPEQI